MRRVLLLAAIALVATPAAAQKSDPAPSKPNEIIYRNIAGPAEVPDAPNGDDTMVCNYQRETGTLFEERVCRTLRAWKTMQADSREFVEFQHLGAHQAQGN